MTKEAFDLPGMNWFRINFLESLNSEEGLTFGAQTLASLQIHGMRVGRLQGSQASIFPF
jgi:hypothetical protein